MRGKLATTAKTRTLAPRIGDWESYEVRYHSISSISFQSGAPTMDGVSPHSAVGVGSWT